jgi:hypothetical protein
MGKCASVFFTTLLLVTLAWGCSDNKSKWGDEFYDEMLNYEEQKVATFNITGTLNCERCVDGDLPVAGIMVEVIPKADPTNILAAKMFDGTGPFTVSNIRWKSGDELTITAMVFTEVDKVQFTEHETVIVPDEDGDSVAVTINF